MTNRFNRRPFPLSTCAWQRLTPATVDPCCPLWGLNILPNLQGLPSIAIDTATGNGPWCRGFPCKKWWISIARTAWSRAWGKWETLCIGPYWADPWLSDTFGKIPGVNSTSIRKKLKGKQLRHLCLSIVISDAPVLKSMLLSGGPREQPDSLWFVGNVGIAIINHPCLMVFTTHLWWLGGWFIIAIPTFDAPKSS